jgi:hypothetical protein
VKRKNFISEVRVENVPLKQTSIIDPKIVVKTGSSLLINIVLGLKCLPPHLAKASAKKI